MHFNRHYNLGMAGSHAFLSPSKYAWINYEDDQLDRVFASSLASQKGTRLHDLAAQLIKENIKLPKTGATLNRYVNDAIGFRMTPEQVLYYSDNAYGTADAISFNKNKLRVFDLKTGASPASFSQIDVYFALFCLEYRANPFELDMEARIYQNDAFVMQPGDPDKIMHIKEKIKRFDKRITEMRLEAQGL